MVSYRPALPDDQAAIAAIHAESWRASYRGILRDEFLDAGVFDDRKALWRQRLEHPVTGQYVEIAMAEGNPVGFICVFADDDPRYGAKIDNVHVVPSHLGRGIGSALISHAFDWLAARQQKRGVYLWVYQQNAAARRLYQRLGARHVETVDKANPGGGTGRSCRYAWKNPGTLAVRGS